MPAIPVLIAVVNQLAPLKRRRCGILDLLAQVRNFAESPWREVILHA
jgi:hypothetical protein